MSGGVDSTVAALLLKEEGHEVEGITFWFWSFPGAPDYAGKTKCCSLDSTSLAVQELGIPHRTIDASDRFYELVLRDYVARYRRGETPNPCGRCNRYLRFGLALQYAQEHGFDRVATGHHVRIMRDQGGRPHLYRGADPGKDQSYFLYGLTEGDLEHLIFPVGGLSKEKVFAIARERGLHAATLPESQDLCFAQKGRTDFLFDPTDRQPGPILDLAGRHLGDHEGLPLYTIGQRRGLKVTAERPLYVVAIDKGRNALIVGDEKDLYATGLTATEATYISGDPPPEGTRLEAKIRYRSPAVPATFHPLPGARFSLEFKEPQRAVTPGQIAALYDDDRLLGGGIIAERQ
jgi:tRNA-specific 2-thiouridylase